MMLERYEFISDETYQNFEFISKGPNGNVIKIVRFTLRNTAGVTYIHLGFGDWNEKIKRIDDLVITNNKDKQKILATIAAIVLAFTKRFPDMAIFAIGSTPSRTRLYQMSIFTHWHEIEPLFYMYGMRNKNWEPFKKGVNYEAFLIRRRKLNFTT